MACDIICINETFLNPPDADSVAIPKYNLHACGGGRGKGVAIYTSHHFAPAAKRMIAKDKFQIIQLQYLEMDIKPSF